MHFPTPLRLTTFVVSIFLRAVLVNHVAAWLQTPGVDSTLRAVLTQRLTAAAAPLHKTSPGSLSPTLRGILMFCTVSGLMGEHDAQDGTSLSLPTRDLPRAPLDAPHMGMVLSAGAGPVLCSHPMPARPPLGAAPVNASLMPEPRARNHLDGQFATASAGDGALCYAWDSPFGTILIQVDGEEIFVNGQRVEPHGNQGTGRT